MWKAGKEGERRSEGEQKARREALKKEAVGQAQGRNLTETLSPPRQPASSLRHGAPGPRSAWPPPQSPKPSLPLEN